MKNWIFFGVMVYAFAATAILWKLDLRHSFGWFCIVCAAGIPLPFAIEKAWKLMNG